ncbi:unnamed protein product [Caenorhabditis bovis]|uniref:Uncharacterized protein n=1 Tax=Caenorhabditis bovis TaxID=2654633 RepID=A0A8S1EI12_9PELO|nr:unnamed protein product [Caenorhabditis bovis]
MRRAIILALLIIAIKCDKSRKQIELVSQKCCMPKDRECCMNMINYGLPIKCGYQRNPSLAKTLYDCIQKKMFGSSQRMNLDDAVCCKLFEFDKQDPSKHCEATCKTVMTSPSLGSTIRLERIKQCTLTENPLYKCFEKCRQLRSEGIHIEVLKFDEYCDYPAEQSIRKTANISKEMREEIQQQGERFENTVPPAPTPPPKSENGETSMRSDLVSQKILLASSIKILQEERNKYENHAMENFAKSEDTRSYCTIDEFKDDESAKLFEQNCDTTVRAPPQVVPLNIVNNLKKEPQKAPFLSDFDLCQAMENKKQHPQAIAVESHNRFHNELAFCNSIIEDVERVIKESRRFDLELTVIKYRDKNDMPRCKIEIIRKIATTPIPKEVPQIPSELDFEDEPEWNKPDGLRPTPIFQVPMVAVNRFITHVKIISEDRSSQSQYERSPVLEKSFK